MARREEFKMNVSERQRRRFSENFKRDKVREIESGKTKLADICRQYNVSRTSIYKWISKFGTMKKNPERLIVESKSDTLELLALKKKVAELERSIGQKQVLLDFQDKMMELAQELYGIDIKKKLSGKLLGTTGKTEKK